MDSTAFLLESAMIVGIMLGVTFQSKKRPRYCYVLFFALTAALLRFTTFAVVWDVLLIMLFVIVGFSVLFEVPLYKTALAGVVTYMIFTGTQMATTLLEMFLFDQAIDFRLIIREGHLFTKMLALLGSMLLVSYYNHTIAIPRRRMKGKSSIKDGIAQMNMVMAALVLFIGSLNLRYMYQNWADIGEMPGLKSNLILMALFLSVLMVVLMFLLNRYRHKSYTLGAVKKSASRDAMTGFYNRNAGLAALTKEMEKTRNTGFPLTISFIDVNNLKVVNDRFGHEEGDRLIMTIVDVLKECLRDRDIVARMGGDEFIVAFTGCDMRQSRRVWTRIQEQLKGVNLSGERRYSVGVSAGFVEFDPAVHHTLEELLSCADAEMYRHKRLVKGARMAQTPFHSS